MSCNKYSEEDYKYKCADLGLTYIGYYKKPPRNDTYIQFICKKHSNKGIQEKDWGHFRTCRKGCPYCTGRYMTTEEAYKKAGNDNIEFISEYIGNEKPITVRCKICGYEWTTIARGIINGKHGCPICNTKIAHKKHRKTHDKFVEDLSEVNPNIEVIGEYTGTHKKVRCRCLIDGTEWDAYPANLLNLSAGCPKCNILPSERKMVDTLLNLGFNITQQYMIDGCEHIHKLRFDAFDADRNIAFEFNGEQHYKVVDFSGKHPDRAKLDFETTQIRDNIKIKYCEENNIPLIIVPYWERNNMESFIISELKMKGVTMP